jgi:hypothetical protein
VTADPALSEAVTAERIEITADFFTALGVQMRAGRWSSRSDSSAGHTAIVNETLARRSFQRQEAIGSRLWIAGTPHDIVGVVADYASNPLQAGRPAPRVFVPLPLDSTEIKRLTFLVRAVNDPSTLVPTVRTDARKVAPGTIVGSVETVDEVIDIGEQEMLVGTAPFVPIVTIGVMLTATGIYGVLAFAIARRSRELAIRVAVGASGRDVVRIVTSHTLRLIAVGSTLGLMLMYALARVVRAGGGAGSIWDPSLHAFIVPVIVVFIVGALASWIPSRRALKIDPVALLRSQ